MADKVFWIGDDGDNKSVSINREIYVRGDDIPAEDVAPKLLDEWLEKGLISTGDNILPVVIKDTEAVKNLEIEIASLKRDLDRLPGLQREISELKKAADKAKSGTKVKRVKELEAQVKGLEDVNAGIETDVREKAALIEQQTTRITELEAEVETLTAPGGGGSDDQTGGP